jgi:predicted HTH transcriptional regulator
MSPKETQTTEWKESWRDEYIRWVCGFANAQGGKLIIGKNDKGALLGVANAKKLLEDIPNKIKDILGIIVDVNLRVEQGNHCDGVPAPKYRTDASGLMVQFHTGIRQEERMTEKTSEKIIALLKSDGSLSSAALAAKIGKSTRTVERALRKLRESRVIERIGPDKGGHWVVKEGKP